MVVETPVRHLAPEDEVSFIAGDRQACRQPEAPKERRRQRDAKPALRCAVCVAAFAQ
jgi:hypothetical protein